MGLGGDRGELVDLCVSRPAVSPRQVEAAAGVSGAAVDLRGGGGGGGGG